MPSEEHQLETIEIPKGGEVMKTNGHTVTEEDDSVNSTPEHGYDSKTFIQTDDSDMQEIGKERSYVEKFVYTVSVVTLVVLAYGVYSLHWLLPYYYTVSFPCLYIIRLVLYWKAKYQYFMLDFCYLGNFLTMIFIWGLPGYEFASVVIFGLANGPLAWATVLFRNSLVFHDYDRMTSTYIHVLPMFISYSARWFPSSLSQYWYTPFNTDYSEDVAYMFIWLVAVPFAIFLFHSVSYMVLVHCICRPSPDYLNSFSYLSAKENASCTGRSISCCGRCTTKRGKFGVYTILTLLYGTVSLLLLPLWYKYFIAHTIYMSLVIMVIIWNGASYYMDVFAKRGHVRA